MQFLSNEIIKDSTLIELFSNEELDLNIKENINLCSRSFFSIKSKDLKKSNIEENELIIVRLNKAQIKYEYITKIRKWGKVNIPLDIVKILDLKNKEIIEINIIKNKEFNSKGESIDLYEILKDVKRIKMLNKRYEILKKEYANYLKPIRDFEEANNEITI